MIETRPITSRHLNWELIGQVAKELKETEGKALKEAHEEVEEEEDEHLLSHDRVDTGIVD